MRHNGEKTIADLQLRVARDTEDIDRLKKQLAALIPYRQVVGSLLYLVTGTRPDIAAAVANVCKYMANPGKQHWDAVKQIVRYLKGTAAFGITLGGDSTELNGFASENFELTGYVDADHAGDIDNRISLHMDRTKKGNEL